MSVQNALPIRALVARDVLKLNRQHTNSCSELQRQMKHTRTCAHTHLCELHQHSKEALLTRLHIRVYTNETRSQSKYVSFYMAV